MHRLAVDPGHQPEPHTSGRLTQVHLPAGDQPAPGEGGPATGHSLRASLPGTVHTLSHSTHSFRASLSGTHTHTQPLGQSTRYTHLLTAFGPVYQVSYYKLLYTGYYKFTALLTELCSLKGTVRRDFQFFSSFQPACATDQWVKIFLILVKFSPSYLHFYESPRGLILRRVNLPRVSYPGESYDFSRSYLKGQYNQIFDMFFS